MPANFIYGIGLGLVIGLLFYFLERRRNSLLNNRLQDEIEMRMRAQANYEALKNKYQDFDKLIKTSIKSEVLDAFQKTNDQLMRIAKEQIEKNLQTHSNKLDSIVKPFEQVIDEYRQRVEQFFKSSTEKLSGLNRAIDDMRLQSNDLAQKTQELVKVLQSPTQRGQWGEMQLRRIFEIIGWKEGTNYQEQVTAQATRPDFIVTLPNERKIIIDVKMTMSAYWDYMEADDDKVRNKLAHRHVEALRTRIKELSQKAYWQQHEDSLDYVVLYMPIEAAFALAVSIDTDLFNYAIKQRIVLASPSTIIPLVQMIDAMWRQDQAYRSVSQVVDAISELRNRYDVLLGHLDTLGKKIGETAESYNKLVGSWQRKFDPQLRRIEQFKKGKDLRELPDQIDKDLRSVK